MSDSEDNFSLFRSPAAKRQLNDGDDGDDHPQGVAKRIADARQSSLPPEPRELYAKCTEHFLAGNKLELIKLFELNDELFRQALAKRLYQHEGLSPLLFAFVGWTRGADFDLLMQLMKLRVSDDIFFASNVPFYAEALHALCPDAHGNPSPLWLVTRAIMAFVVHPTPFRQGELEVVWRDLDARLADAMKLLHSISGGNAQRPPAAVAARPIDAHHHAAPAPDASCFSSLASSAAQPSKLPLLSFDDSSDAPQQNAAYAFPAVASPYVEEKKKKRRASAPRSTRGKPDLQLKITNLYHREGDHPNEVRCNARGCDAVISGADLHHALMQSGAESLYKCSGWQSFFCRLHLEESKEVVEAQAQYCCCCLTVDPEHNLSSFEAAAPALTLRLCSSCKGEPHNLHQLGKVRERRQKNECAARKQARQLAMIQ